MNKLNMSSKNIICDNLEKLKEIFPNIINDGNIDFDMLKQELHDYIVEDKKEKYQLTWPGKKEALVLANTPTNKTLRPDREKSVNFNSTENLYIEGDNLEVLKILQESYLNKIKLIYIDPPYNTGNDFVYKDNFNNSLSNELEESGQIDENGYRLISNNQSSGRYHSNWLSMMYSRIKLSRNLLKEDGLIFISIDDNEMVNLKKICDEIFGEFNCIATLPTVMNLKGNQDEFGFAGTHEYTLVYSKNKSMVSIGQFDVDAEEIEKEWQEDEKGYYKKGAIIRATGTDGDREKRPYMFYPVLIKDNKISMIEREEYEKLYNSNSKTFDDIYLNSIKSKYENMGYYVLIPYQPDGGYGRWRWGFDTMYENIDEIIINNSGDVSLYKKQRPALGDIPSKKPKSLFYKAEYSSGNGTSQLSSLFGKRIFDNPKPLDLIKDFIYISTKDNDIILDFFSGSATTAHATLELNAKYGKNLKYILVQLPEKYDENSEGFKNGYSTICDLAIERIKRASNNIKNATGAKIDYGFRVYKVDSSNMKDVYYKPNEIIQANLFDYMSNVKDDRTAEDLLTQVMLDLGLTLDLKIEEKNIFNNKVYFVENNSLIACFDEKININIVDEICKYNPLKVVFKDSSFKSDKDKINLEEKIKKLSPDTEVSVL